MSTARIQVVGKIAGEDGITPHIGANGNWFIGETDTNVKAEGKDGYTPQKGIDYFDGKKGDAFTYADFTPEQLTELKGKTGDAGVYYGVEAPTDPSHPVWINPNGKPTYIDEIADMVVEKIINPLEAIIDESGVLE